MSNTWQVYRVFLSGPADVGSDVELIKQCISEINLLLAHTPIRFEAFHWVESVTPGVDSEPQARVNRQAQGYDIILALLGARLGTPTSQYPSGTAEEVVRALDAIDSLEFGLDSVMVFFKSVQIDAAFGDLEEAIRVRQFRDYLSERGLVYKHYDDSVALRNSVFRALGNIIGVALGYLAHNLPSGFQPELELPDEAVGGEPPSSEAPIEEDDTGPTLIDMIANGREDAQAILAPLTSLAHGFEDIIGQIADAALEAKDDSAAFNAIIQQFTREIDQLNKNVEIYQSSLISDKIFGMFQILLEGGFIRPGRAGYLYHLSECIKSVRHVLNLLTVGWDAMFILHQRVSAFNFQMDDFSSARISLLIRLEATMSRIVELTGQGNGYLEQLRGLAKSRTGMTEFEAVPA